MFVGWIRKDTLNEDIEALAQEITCDKNLIVKSYKMFPHQAFGIYDDKKLVAFISGYLFQELILINNFYYIPALEESYKERLITLLLVNLAYHDKTVLVLAKQNEAPLFNKEGFLHFADFYKALYSDKRVSFNFTTQSAKAISNENYLATVRAVEKEAVLFDRSAYLLETLKKSSSLMLSTQNGYQHSYALDRNLIKISPWVMRDGAFDDAEKLLQGIIYHRGLKKIVAFVPKDVKEITDLYRSYGFDFVDEYSLLYLGKKPDINLEMVYSL